MGKLNPETAQTIWDLQKQLLEIIDTAKTDAGNNWTVVAQSITTAQLLGVSFPDSLNGFAVGRDNTILKFSYN